MAHQITKSDNIVLAKQAAWHGLGTVVQEAMTPYQAMHLAGLDWEVEKAPVYALIESDNGTVRVPMEERYCIYRKDNGELFKTLVTDHYQIMQNKQMFDHIYEVAKTDDDISVETAFSLRGGRTVGCLVQLASLGLQSGDDVIKQYAYFRLAHDGNGSYQVGGTNVRVVCANTDAYATGMDEFISVRHMGERITNNDRICSEIQALLGDLKEQSKLYGQQMEKALETEWDEARVAEYFTKVWSKINGGIDSNPESVNHKRMMNTIQGWKDNAYDHVNQENCRGTAYAAYQAVTQYSSHDVTIRNTGAGDVDARRVSQLEGRGKDIASKAQELLLTAIS